MSAARCQAWPLPGRYQCVNSAAVRMVAACRHEHVDTGDFCDSHAAQMDTMLCADCFEIDGHRCSMTGKVLERIG